MTERELFLFIWISRRLKAKEELKETFAPPSKISSGQNSPVL
jgi:hypothetical protein